MASRKVNNQDECCGLCREMPACAAAVLYGGTCYLKAAKDIAGGNYSRPGGRVACIPIKTPAQAPPVLGNAVEGGSCVFKAVADLASKVTNVTGSTACVPEGTQSTGTFTINATVPGELVTDLQRAGKVLDPLSSNNHKDPSQVKWWNGNAYTYTKKFTVPASHPAMVAVGGGDVQLVLEGVKLGATVSLNGHVLGNTTNQHLRYTFLVGQYLQPQGSANTLSVRFERDIANGGRFMACSGGWGACDFS
jgi:hypothetical protein